MEIRESTKQTAIAAATAAAATDDEKDEREDDAGDAAEEKQDRGKKDQPAPDAASHNEVGEEVEAPGAPVSKQLHFLENAAEEHEEEGEDEWDEEDNITGVAISTAENYFVVQNVGKGRELLRHLNEEVEVQGTVTKDEETGYDIITVTAYKIVE